MKILLVDNERHCRTNLAFLLEKYCTDITEIKMADSVDSAQIILENYTPDILFLDIQMPKKDGFHLLRTIDTENILVIFVTAHEEYAIEAIKCGPTGYLLKPIDITELKETFHTALEQLNKNLLLDKSYQTALTALSEVLESKKKNNKICLTHSSKLEIVNLKDITLLTSDNYYTTFFLSDGRRIVMSKTLKTYENILGDQFKRIHRSHIINIEHITEFCFDNHKVTLSSGQKIPVSRRKTQEVISLLKCIS